MQTPCIVQTFALYCGWMMFTGYLSFAIFTPTVVATAGDKWLHHEAKNGRRCVVSLEDALTGNYVTKFIAQRALRWLVIATTLVLFVVFLIFAVVRLDVDRNQPVAWRGNTNYGDYETSNSFSFAPTATGNSVKVGQPGTPRNHLWSDAVCWSHCRIWE